MDTFFWVLSKLFWAVASPDKILLVVLLAGTISLWTRRHVLGRWMVTIAMGITMVIAVFPVGETLRWVLENRFPIPKLPEKADGIIVLSGAETPSLTIARGQPVFGDAAERLTSFVYLANRYPEAKLVFSGGSGSLRGQEYKAALTARMLFRQLGLDLNRVLFESDSRNTWENVVFSHNLVKPESGEIWILIDSAFRLPRTVGIFRKAGWEVIPYPVDFHSEAEYQFYLGFGGFGKIKHLSNVLREWIGIVAYWATGRMSELFPGPSA